MAAIFKREFKSYFQSVIGWLFIAVTLCLYGLYFVVYNLSYGYAYISYSLSAITFIFLITVPVLTMRVFAEERNKKTDQLILTSPVSLGKIVFAKFLAMVAVFSIAIAVIALSPLLLKALGSAPLKESYVGILAVRGYLYRDRNLCVITDREPGDLCGDHVRTPVFGLYDGRDHKSDLHERKYTHKDPRML